MRSKIEIEVEVAAGIASAMAKDIEALEMIDGNYRTDNDRGLLLQAIKHLREEADFNRSWMDDPGYIAARIGLAEKREGWADAIERLAAEKAKLEMLVDRDAFLTEKSFRLSVGLQKADVEIDRLTAENAKLREAYS